MQSNRPLTDGPRVESEREPHFILSLPRETRITLIILALLVVAGLFAWFVWPTPYTYGGGDNGNSYRTNRFTGQMQSHVGDSWMNN